MIERSGETAMQDGASKAREDVAGLHCPICKAPATQRYKPFCCKRCGDIDLGRWVTGAYVIPGGGEADAEDDAGAGGTTGKEPDLPLADR